jgi:hypothetical protein
MERKEGRVEDQSTLPLPKNDPFPLFQWTNLMFSGTTSTYPKSTHRQIPDQCAKIFCK